MSQCLKNNIVIETCEPIKSKINEVMSDINNVNNLPKKILINDDLVKIYTFYDINDVNDLSKKVLIEDDLIKIYNNLIKKCKHDINDSSYVYKICGNYFVVMQKLHDTIDTESRANIIIAERAKYRADKLLVTQIINIYDLNKQINSIINNFYNKTATYTVGEMSMPDHAFNHDLNIVSGSGIHYFKKTYMAFGYINVPPNYSGTWSYFNANGTIADQGNYKNGRLTGAWYRYDENGDFTCIANY